MADRRQEQEARAREALEALTADEWDYEHMGDMARDMRPLAEDVLALAAEVSRLETERDQAIAALEAIEDIVNKARGIGGGDK